MFWNISKLTRKALLPFFPAGRWRCVALRGVGWPARTLGVLEKEHFQGVKEKKNEMLLLVASQ